MAKMTVVSAANQTSQVAPELLELIKEFVVCTCPLEQDRLHLFTDARTGATFIECHIKAGKLVALSTVDVPLDPDEQGDYRANREIVADHAAYKQMQADAVSGRAFSNIVCEYSTAYTSDTPLKIIGGQHRFEAIKLAAGSDVDEYHGIKVYFGLDSEQRLDVQLISNTNIAVSSDLYDRMQETVTGPALRNWCQTVGLLQAGQDFADKRQRGEPITVRIARTFIMNYYRGTEVDTDSFDTTQTTPMICQSGTQAEDWDELKRSKPRMWSDAKLQSAGTEFAELIKAQRAAFARGKGKDGPNSDFANKGLNYAVMSAWAYVAGVLHNNQKRLQRHFDLRKQTTKDPLNAATLAKGRHKTDPENYRGLGYRTDAKERGRLVELFYLQAESGDGITKHLIDLAIKKYHAKQAQIDVLLTEESVKQE